MSVHGPLPAVSRVIEGEGGTDKPALNGSLEVSAGIHSVVKHAYDEHIITFTRVEDDVRAMLKAAETFGQLLGSSAQARIRYEIREASDQLVSIASCLFDSESVDRERGDRFEISCRTSREAVFSHLTPSAALRPPPRYLQCFGCSGRLPSPRQSPPSARVLFLDHGE